MIIKGTDIVGIQTIGSKFNNQCVKVFTAKEIYLMKVSQILKFNTDFNDLDFRVIHKLKNNYLEVI